MSPNAPHIDSPELLTRLERVRDTFATALMWAIYVYLWLPLVSLVAWLAGFELAYDVMVREGGAGALGGILVGYGIVFVTIALVVTGWSFWNRMRFGKRQRRGFIAATPDAEIAHWFGVDLETLARFRTLETLTVDVDTDGQPVLVGAAEAPVRHSGERCA